MRVLFLNDAVFEDLPGGSRLAARQLAKGLTEKGHDVTFLVARHKDGTPETELIDGMRIVRYDGAGQGRQYIKHGRRACQKLWAEAPFDIVHSHFAYAGIGPFMAVPPRVPRIRTFHGPWDEEGLVDDLWGKFSLKSRCLAYVKARMRYGIEQHDLSSSTAIITLSDCFREKVIGRYGIRNRPIKVIHGGADIERFKPRSDKASLRKALDLPTDRRIIISVRRLAPRMGLDNLIAALPLVLKTHPDLLLLIGGTGPESVKLKKLTEELSLGSHVRFLGFIPDDQLADYYRLSDLFVLPTLKLEGFGLVTIEALASGLPVIGTPVGATIEILGALEPQLLTTGTKPRDLAAAIVKFFESSLPLRLTPENLHQYVREHYRWDFHVDAVLHMYADALRSN